DSRLCEAFVRSRSATTLYRSAKSKHELRQQRVNNEYNDIPNMSHREEAESWLQQLLLRMPDALFWMASSCSSFPAPTPAVRFQLSNTRWILRRLPRQFIPTATRTNTPTCWRARSLP